MANGVMNGLLTALCRCTTVRPTVTPGAPLSLMIQLIALLSFVGAIGTTVLVSLGRAASLDRDLPMGALSSTTARQGARDIAV